MKNNYQIFDVNGLVDEFTTIIGLQRFRDFLFKKSWVETINFIMEGSSLISESLADEIEAMESFNPDTQVVIEKLRDILKESDTVMIIKLEE